MPSAEEPAKEPVPVVAGSDDDKKREPAVALSEEDQVARQTLPLSAPLLTAVCCRV